MVPPNSARSVVPVALLAMGASCMAPPAAPSALVPVRGAARSGPVQSEVSVPAGPVNEGGGLQLGRPAFRIYGGHFEASAPEGFANETHRSSIGLGATWPELRHRLFSIDADVLWTDREFDALIADPPGLPIPARADLSTIGITGGGRATFPVEGPVRVYAGGGLGLYWSDLSADGTSSSFSMSDSDFSPGAYLLAGVDVTLGHLLLGLNYRRWFVDGDFSSFGLEGVDLGGDFFGLVIGTVF